MSALPDVPTPLRVAAVAMVNADGRVLMQQRAPGGMHEGLWEFPGGKLEAGETYAHAALRELHEELGVVLCDQSLVPVSRVSGPLSGANSPRQLTIALFACRVWSGSPDARVATRLGWYDPAELAGLAMPPLDYPLAEGLVKLLHADVF